MSATSGTSENWLILRPDPDPIDLKTRDLHVGRAKCDAFIGTVADAGQGGWTRARLSVTEPCAFSFIELMEAPEVVEAGAAMAIRSNMSPGEYDAWMASGGHRHDDVVSSVIARLGPPTHADWLVVREDVRWFGEDDASGVTWGWQIEAEAGATLDIEALWTIARELDRDVLYDLETGRVGFSGKLEAQLADGATVVIEPSLSLGGSYTSIDLHWPGGDPDSEAFGAFWDGLTSTLGKVKPDAVRSAYRFGDQPHEIGTTPCFYRGTGVKPKAFKKPKDPLKKGKIAKPPKFLRYDGSFALRNASGAEAVAVFRELMDALATSWTPRRVELVAHERADLTTVTAVGDICRGQPEIYVRSSLPTLLDGRYEGLKDATGHEHAPWTAGLIEALGVPDTVGWRNLGDTENPADSVRWGWRRGWEDVADLVARLDGEMLDGTDLPRMCVRMKLRATVPDCDESADAELVIYSERPSWLHVTWPHPAQKTDDPALAAFCDVVERISGRRPRDERWESARRDEVGALHVR